MGMLDCSQFWVRIKQGSPLLLRMTCSVQPYKCNQRAGLHSGAGQEFVASDFLGMRSPTFCWADRTCETIRKWIWKKKKKKNSFQPQDGGKVRTGPKASTVTASCSCSLLQPGLVLRVDAKQHGELQYLFQPVVMGSLHFFCQTSLSESLADRILPLKVNTTFISAFCIGAADRCMQAQKAEDLRSHPICSGPPLSEVFSQESYVFRWFRGVFFFFSVLKKKKISVLPSTPADTNTGLETRGSTRDSLCIAFKNLAPPLCGFSQPDSCLLMLLWRYFVLGM